MLAQNINTYNILNAKKLVVSESSATIIEDILK
jgi:hypothetical protein